MALRCKNKVRSERFFIVERTYAFENVAEEDLECFTFKNGLSASETGSTAWYLLVDDAVELTSILIRQAESILNLCSSVSIGYRNSLLNAYTIYPKQLGQRI